MFLNVGYGGGKEGGVGKYAANEKNQKVTEIKTERTLAVSKALKEGNAIGGRLVTSTSSRPGLTSLALFHGRPTSRRGALLLEAAGFTVTIVSIDPGGDQDLGIVFG